jgi:hypothetical protein
MNTSLGLRPPSIYNTGALLIVLRDIIHCLVVLAYGYPHSTKLRLQKKRKQKNAPASAECKSTEKLEAAGKARRTASKEKVDAERANKLATWHWRRRRESPTARRKKGRNYEKAARAAQAAQRKKDRDRNVADEADNLVE